MKMIKTIPLTAVVFYALIVSSLECAGRVFSGWEMIRFLSEHFQKYETIITFV